MSKRNNEYLSEMARQEKQFDAMYRNISEGFAFPDCAMWILYFLSSSDEDISQQELIEMMMFPKQTINSSVKSLSEKGLLTLEMIPGTRNKKRILLTGDGRKKADETVSRLRRAELKAVKKMGSENMEKYIELYHELYESMHEEFLKEGLIDEAAK